MGLSVTPKSILTAPHECKVAVVVPVRNALAFADQQVAALQQQTRRPDRVIILDSESKDGSASVYRSAGYEVHTIPQALFDHGGTRNAALALVPDAHIVVYLTQDAIPYDRDALERIVAPFADPAVAIVCGRQVPRPGAGAIERHARVFNYPGAGSRRTLSDASAMGIKAVFASNSFAAYRSEALVAIGGFPTPVIMGEDAVAAGKALINGWTVVYAADAIVTHSHSYTMMQEFRRYFDIGVLHARASFLIERFGGASRDGQRYVASELRYLLRHAPMRIPEALARTSLKLAGYRLGRREQALPVRLKRRLSMHHAFFDGLEPTTVPKPPEPTAR